MAGSSSPLVHLCPAPPPSCPASACEEGKSMRNDFSLKTPSEQMRSCDDSDIGSVTLAIR